MGFSEHTTCAIQVTIEIYSSGRNVRFSYLKVPIYAVFGDILFHLVNLIKLGKKSLNLRG